MIERQYIKLNTSIQTGSNSNQLSRDADGNVEATIELRLPDNIFGTFASSPIDSISMQTSKMRLSMENIPIAHLPLSEELSREVGTNVSTCCLDIWPFCLCNDDPDHPVQPRSLSDTPFPNYKNHYVMYRQYIRDEDNEFLDYQLPIHMYDPAEEIFAVFIKNRWTDTPYTTQSAMRQLTNLMVPSHLESYVDRSAITLPIRHIGTLEQVLQDALETAFTFASSDIYYAYKRVVGSTNSHEITTRRNDVDLLCSVKPKVTIMDQSLSISYDLAPFMQHEMLPILWAQGYVDTHDMPDAIARSMFLSSWTQPPAKRAFRYGVSSSSTGYAMTLPDNWKIGPFNIIGNKEMHDTFSFLPWIPVDSNTDSLMDFTAHPNFDIEDVFYLLDCTPAQLKIESAEPVNLGDENYLWKVTRDAVKRTVTQERNVYRIASYKEFYDNRFGTDSFGMSLSIWCKKWYLLPEPGTTIDLDTDYVHCEMYWENIENQGLAGATYNIEDVHQPGWRLIDEVDESADLIYYSNDPSLDPSITYPWHENYPDQTSTREGPRFEFVREITRDVDGEARVEHSYCMFQPPAQGSESPDAYVGVWTISDRVACDYAWIPPRDHIAPSYVHQGYETIDGVQYFTYIENWSKLPAGMDYPMKAKGTLQIIETQDIETKVTSAAEGVEHVSSNLISNVRLTYTWNNLPLVVMSPLSSIVMTIGGIHINEEIQPVNIAERSGSSLTSSIPIIENYYALATTLRDLHDELVITRQDFDTTATYTLETTSGQERTITLSAKYITKDGTIHQIYIPPNGVFSVQLTFCVSFLTF